MKKDSNAYYLSMHDEITSTTSKKDSKFSSRNNKVIPITSIADLGAVVAEMQNQLNLLISKSNSGIGPEFKALMEAFVTKANEAEKLKTSLENIGPSNGQLKAEVAKFRETNRNLIKELEETREVLDKLEHELNTYETSSQKTEEEYKEKIKKLTKQNDDYENKISELEDEALMLKMEKEKFRQEFLDKNFNSHKKTQELVIQRDQFVKQLEEVESLLVEQTEKLELKSKEVEYLDTLLNQLLKQSLTHRLRPKSYGSEESESYELEMGQRSKKRRPWFF